MRTQLAVCALSIIALAACGRDEAPKPAATSGVAKADEKKEEAKPMPPAAPTAAPAEGAKR
jgi:uncharacterized lipoprotein